MENVGDMACERRRVLRRCSVHAFRVGTNTAKDAHHTTLTRITVNSQSIQRHNIASSHLHRLFLWHLKKGTIKGIVFRCHSTCGMSFHSRMQFRVVVPEDVKTGDKIRMKCPDGTEADTLVPSGHKPGDTFLIELPVEQLKSPQKILDVMLGYSAASGSFGFLSRNVSGLKDILLAAMIGIVIAYWTIFGFFAGVLYATRDMLIATKPA